MAGTRSLTGAVAISLGLHAAVLVVPIRGGHYSPAKSGVAVLQVSLESEAVAPPAINTVSIATTNEQSESIWVATPTRREAAPSPEIRENGAGLLPLPETRKPIYFTAKELHLRPSPIGTVLKEEAGRIYPDSSTRLLIQINEQGRVDHAEILSANNDTFASEALQAFAGARYIPGAIAGKKVKSELRVEVISSNDFGVVLRATDQ